MVWGFLSCMGEISSQPYLLEKLGLFWAPRVTASSSLVISASTNWCGLSWDGMVWCYLPLPWVTPDCPPPITAFLKLMCPHFILSWPVWPSCLTCGPTCSKLHPWVSQEIKEVSWVGLCSHQMEGYAGWFQGVNRSLFSLRAGFCCPSAQVGQQWGWRGKRKNQKDDFLIWFFRLYISSGICL